MNGVEIPLGALHGPDARGCFIAEASDLGLKPGEWPSVLRAGVTTFVRFTDRLDDERELVGVVYLKSGGGTLTIFND